MKLRTHTTHIFIHCSATQADANVDVEDIRKWHTDPRPRGNGWSRLGYHFFIKRSGVVQSGLSPDLVGIHVRGFNSQSLGICLEGGLDDKGKPEDNFTDAQFESLSALLRMCKIAYPGAKILGHRDASPDLDGDGIIEEHEWLKACPCFDVKTELKPGGRLNKVT